MTDNDAILIEACKQQDPVAQKKLYELYAPTMLGICRRYMGSKMAAEDVFHDAFIKVLTNINSFQGKSSIYTWMRAIMVHTALNAIRSNTIKQKYCQDSISDSGFDQKLDDNIFSKFSTQELMDVITTLPDIYRTIFNLREVEGYEYAEIATEMDITESYARVCLARAKNMLRNKLNQEYNS